MASYGNAPNLGEHPPSHAGMVRYVCDQMGLRHEDYTMVARILQHARDFIVAGTMDQGFDIRFQHLGTFRRKLVTRGLNWMKDDKDHYVLTFTGSPSTKRVGKS